jgi:hypothetical protein
MRHSQTGHRWQYNLAYGFCLLDNWGYRHTLRICNTYYFSLASIVANAPASLLRLYVQCLASCSSGDKHFSTFEWLPVALCYEHWGSIVYFQVKFLDSFRHFMQATDGKIRQFKAWTVIDYLVLTWHKTPECGRRLNGLVTLHWSVEISFVDWWVIKATRKLCKR